LVPDEVEEPTGVDRISDANRYLTAIEISQEGWTKSDTIVLARGDNYADALAGVPFAHQLNAPILLTLPNDLYEETLAEIARLGAKKVVILGGESAISAKVAGELKAAGLTVERISGSDRFETAAKIASEMESSDKVIIANGMDFPDALSVAAHAAKSGMPILLTQADKLPVKTVEALERLGATKTIVVGGKTVVSEKVVKQLPKPTTLSGADRYETNIAVAEHFGVTSKHMYVATGQNYADALTGAVLAAKNDSAVLLVHARIPDVVTTYISDQDLKRLTIFGGESAVSKKVANELEELLQ
ncbi:cell wall-binding repeat-containing protein, partial [Microvirga sp. 3-52]|nr:cell wall-binding repeat-containing protein [Microvirga sp. 3-52]